MNTLSSAIRLGATLRPQAFGQFFQICNGVKCSCVIGAAIEGMELQSPPQGFLEWLLNCFKQGEVSRFNRLERQFPILNEYVDWPVESAHAQAKTVLIMADLNDKHHWSRERIADWIETIEGKKQERGTDRD